MEIYSNRVTRNILKFSIIGLIFVLSCGKVEEQVFVDGDEAVQWYTKLGFKEDMKKIKSDTTLLTRRMGEGDWADAVELCSDIEKSFAALNLASDEIPEEYFELQQMFNDSLAKITQTCREKNFDERRLGRFARQVVEQCRVHGAKVLMNGDADLAVDVGADGVHLTSTRLMSANSRPSLKWCAASCHDRRELEQAASLDLDFAVLSPVKETLSHSHVPPLGWHRFRDFALNLAIPVYALGGLDCSDLQDAWTNGAHGVAMMRGAWLDG
jgi:thiamine-phosphate diphosphorylase